MNRFYRSINPAQSFKHPLDLLYQVGTQKEKNIEDFVNGIQNNLNVAGNYATIYSPDTDYKVQKSNALLQQVNELGKENLDDPIIQGKIRSSIGEFTNDREVLSAMQRTNAYNQWQEEKNKLGDKYAPQNDPFLQLSHLYESTGDKQAGDALRVFQGIDPYFDTDAQLHTTLSKDNVKLDSNTYVNGIYFVTDKSNNGVTAYTKDSTGKMIPADTKLNSALRTLPLEFYDQMKKNWNYYAKGSGISYEDYINDYLNDAVIAATQTEHSLDQRSADWARLAWDQKKEEVKPPNTIPGFTPASPYPSQNLTWRIDSDGNIKTDYGTFDSRNIENVQTEASKNLPGIQGAFAKTFPFLQSVIYKVYNTVSGNKDEEEQTFSKEEQQQYNDIRNIVQAKMKQDNPGHSITEKELNLGIKNYITMASQMNNANYPINVYSDSKDVKEQSALYFIPTGDSKNPIGLQGAYITRKFYGENGTLSGTQWIRDAGNKQPQVIGEFTPDNPYTPYAQPVQTSDGQLSFMEGNLDEINNEGNNFAHDIYLAKYNNITNSNYTDKVSSKYNPNDNSYQVQIKDNGKTYNYNIGGENPTQVEIRGQKTYLYSPEMLYLYLKD